MTSNINKWVLAAIATVASFQVNQTAIAQEKAAVETPQSTEAVNDDEKTKVVAVLNSRTVFKNNPSFSNREKAINAEVKQLRAERAEHQKLIDDREKQAAQLEFGSAERKKLEAEIEKQKSAKEALFSTKQMILQNRTYENYWTTYEEMQKIVKEIAIAKNISVVRRIDGNANIGKSLDLTAQVEKALNAVTVEIPAVTPLNNKKKIAIAPPKYSKIIQIIAGGVIYDSAGDQAGDTKEAQ